ncbi:nSTAND1 domain-containing NTPase [Sorangium sp. So ce887]|uniref:nSTAND1 domain-containing NTPase n=1 Tax=Sorangium sp. So ce887 TaxID=3133324 RepID=UPI003F5FD761
MARAQDFFGRTAEQGETLDAIAKNLPAQILGGAKVGKSSLLRWVERHVPAGRPVAWIDPGVGFSPGMLVAAIARKVNKPEVAARIEQEGATLRAAVEQSGRLGKLVLILDEADKLATVGQGFDEGFFEAMRGHVEGRKITWVSASRRDLYEVFQ